MSLKSIIAIQEEKKKKEFEIFKTVYKRVEQYIIHNVSIGSQACIYTIPEFIWGYPLIDIPRTMNYLLYELNNKGFICYQIDPRNIYITWDLNVIKQKLNNTSKVLFNSYDKKNDNDNDNDNNNSKTNIFDVITRKKIKNKT